MRRIMLVSLALIVMLLCPALIQTALAGLPVQEMPLNPNGAAFEIHADNQGRLWISDYVAGELWRVAANGSAYTAYTVGGSPSDARSDSLGGVWWVDGTSIRRLDPNTGSTQSWDVTSSGGLYGLAIDNQDKLWIADSSLSYVYFFDPGSNQACPYALPGNGLAKYQAAAGTQSWVGDTFNGRLLRFNSNPPRIDWWKLPDGSSPEDVTLDASGNVWYTDSGLNQIGRLTPGTPSQLTVYPLPIGGLPNMLTAAADGKIWYTELTQLTIGELDPASPSGTTSPVTVTGSSDVTDACLPLTPVDTGKAGTTTNDTPTWADATYPTLYNTNGWLIYQLPDTAFPWGIAVTNSGWMVDVSRTLLAKFSLQAPAQAKLTVNKVVENNYGGSLDATDFTLLVDATEVTSGAQNSFAAGAYTVSEGLLPPGYELVGITGDCASDGKITLAPGDIKTCTITNRDIQPQLTVIKHVINNNGGTKTAGDFTMTVTGSSPSPASFAGAESPGTTVHLNAGSYSVGETGPAGYSSSPSAGCSGTIAVGQTKTCTITNTFVPSYKVYIPTLRK